MAWLCKRAIAGLQYTPFDIDQPEDYSLRPYLPFASGTDLLRPASHLTSATQQRASKGRLPDVLTERTHHICSQRFRDLLERFDPGVHYFSPFLLKRKNGEKVGDHYLWTPGQDIDCILTAGMDQCREESENGRRFRISKAEDAAKYQRRHPDTGEVATLRISKRAVAGRHLWLGGMLGFEIELRMFMSDELYAAWTAERFRELDFICPVEEVDIPWDPEANMGPQIEAWRAREANIRRHWPRTPDRHSGGMMSEAT